MKNFRISTDHQTLQQLGKITEQDPRVMRWMGFLTPRRIYPRLPKGGELTVTPTSPNYLPATEHDRTDSVRSTPLDDTGTYIVYYCGLQTRESPTLGVDLSGLVPLTSHSDWDGLPFTAAYF